MNDFDSIKIKKPQTLYEINELITKRFSARSFSKKAISEDQILSIFEAASWAPSSMNEQPWRYKYAHHGTPAFEKIYSCLSPGNQPWAKDAGVLIISYCKKGFEKDGMINRHYMYDTGAANILLLLEAVSMDIYGHEMGGFDYDKTKTLFDIDDNYEIACFIGLGYLDSHENLVEPFKTREITSRSRKPISSFVEHVKI